MATLLITPPGNAVHRDFFSVGGVDIPEDAEMEFSTAVGIVKVRPDFMFPHLALLEALPGSVPVGSVDLRIISATVPPSNVVPITVTAGPAPALRILQTGEAKTRPYTIAFVANPAIESASGVKFGPDPILTNRPGFQNLVLHGLRNLFQVTEDLLRQHDFHARVRIISIFDPT
ncbi:MAG: hypothetical protein LH606_20160, partial [Cytophagaceae bacterium]|nr:hypothetical protein [Cytophagaceae bacterium]